MTAKHKHKMSWSIIVVFKIHTIYADMDWEKLVSLIKGLSLK